MRKEGSRAVSARDRRNFLVPIPRVASFEELNSQVLTACARDDVRVVDRQAESIGEMWRGSAAVVAPAARSSL